MLSKKQKKMLNDLKLQIVLIIFTNSGCIFSYSILNHFKIILWLLGCCLLCRVNVCISLIVRVRGCAQCCVPPPGSVGVQSLCHVILGVASCKSFKVFSHRQAVTTLKTAFMLEESPGKPASLKVAAAAVVHSSNDWEVLW